MTLIDTAKKVFRYGIVTILSQSILFIGTFIAVELLNLPPTLSYTVILTLVYIGVYFSSAHFVFKEKKHGQQSKKFLFAVVFFWLLNTFLYKILVDYFAIHYLVSILVNIVVFGPLRYLVYQNWVFKTKL